MKSRVSDKAPVSIEKTYRHIPRGEALQFRDHRKEHKRLQQWGDLMNPQVSSSTSRTVPIQLKLITQDGDKSTTSYGRKNETFRKLVLESPDKYYADQEGLKQSEQSGKYLRILYNKIHLIGELNHQESKFDKEKQLWSWIAQVYSEGFSSRDPKEVAHMPLTPGLENRSKEVKELPLEGFHTKSITYMALALKIAKDAKAMDRKSWQKKYNHQVHAYDVFRWMQGHMNYYAALKEEHINTLIIQDVKANNIASNKDEDPDSYTYYKDLQKFYLNVKNVNTDATYTEIRKKVFEAYETKNTKGMYKILKKSDTISFFRDNLAAIHNLNFSIVRKDKDKALQKSRYKMGKGLINLANKNDDDFAAISQTARTNRDFEMARKLQNAKLPSIVRLGANHVDGVYKNMSNQKDVFVHNSYQEYLKKSTVKLKA